MNSSKILGIIPARGGSKGIPGKNSRLLGATPLIEYSISTALNSAKISQVIVSTEDSKIAQISRQAGASVPFLRPQELATDESPTIETVKHALNYFINEGLHFDAVCLLQPTVPFREDKDVDDSISLFLDHKVDSVISVRKVPHQYNPHWTFLKNKITGMLEIATGAKDMIVRRQELPNAYYRDGSLYITKSQVILKDNSLYGNQIMAYESQSEIDINLDTLEDWKKAEEYLKSHEN